MMDNHLYNLTSQLLQEHKSLWRMKNKYKEDSKACQACQELWDSLIQEKEANIEKLLKMVKGHMDALY